MVLAVADLWSDLNRSADRGGEGSQGLDADKWPMLPVIRALLARHLLSRLTVVTDAAMLSADNPAVRTALLYQQVRMSSVTDYRTDLWHEATFGAANGDGSEFAVAEGRDVTGWTGLIGGDPMPWRLPPTTAKISSLNLSRNGNALAVVTEDGAVAVWNVRNRTGSTSVRAPKSAPLLPNGVSTGRDQTGRWLAVRLNRAQFQRAEPREAQHTDLLEVYDLAGSGPALIASPPPLADFVQFPDNEPPDRIPASVMIGQKSANSDEKVRLMTPRRRMANRRSCAPTTPVRTRTDSQVSVNVELVPGRPVSCDS
ncbi:hypothetical protein [Nocardia vinacea]|uniref:hypothetical protein n=1 Tax=Nocardia vinacea TaxID=96468 RepID=UPI000305E8BE|nr:hypothetical protein [Nocardia vinacea]